jgi:hypothetical protein
VLSRQKYRRRLCRKKSYRACPLLDLDHHVQLVGQTVRERLHEKFKVIEAILDVYVGSNRHALVWAQW